MPPDLTTAARLAGRLAGARAAVRRSVLRRRRLLAALLSAVAVASALAVTRAPSPPTVEVVVAARDLPAGEVLDAEDLTTARLPPDAVPSRLADDARGRMLAAPVSQGEPVTEVRLVGAGLTEGRPDLTALPVRLPDAGAVALLRVGDVVDLVAVDPQNGDTETVAPGAAVLALPAADEATGPTGLPGRLVVVGVAPRDVPDIADAASRLLVTFAWSTH